MKIKDSCLMLIALLFLNSCALLLDTGSSGFVKDEINLISNHSEERKKAVKLRCNVSSYIDRFITIYFMNETGERLFIEWENARCDDGKIVFSDDRRISMNNAKTDEAVSAHSTSLKREVTSSDNIGSDYILPLFSVKSLKKGSSDHVMLKIPIRFTDGSVEEYTFDIKLFWETTEE